MGFADDEWEKMQHDDFLGSSSKGMGAQTLGIGLVLALHLAFWVGGAVLMFIVGRAIVG